MDVLKPFKALKVGVESFVFGIRFPWNLHKRNYEKCLELIYHIKEVSKRYYGSWNVSDELWLRNFVEKQGNGLNMNFESRLLLELYKNGF